MADALQIALAPLLAAQGLWVRRRVPVLPEAEGPRQGEAGPAGRPVELLIVGDSSAAGVGVDTQEQALAGRLVAALAARGRRVRWRLVARSGVTSAQALALLRESDPPLRADIAVAVLGVNDVVDRVPVPEAIAAREALADWLLREAGARHVAFAALPPVHQFPALPQPLRAMAGAQARRHDRALAAWAARRERVAHVPMDVTLDARVMARDGFHPGEPVYRACGEALAAHLHDHLTHEEAP